MISDMDLMQEPDARVWAREFMARFGGLKRIKINEELMLAWFASCYMAGYDRGSGRIASCGDELEYKLKHQKEISPKSK
jgi:hypothetical protein